MERRRVAEALPDLLEAALADGLRVVVRTPTRELADTLNERLWTFREDSFLPHGGAGDGDAAGQPVYLTEGDEAPNGARLAVLLDPGMAEPLQAAAFERVDVLFDARDEETMAAARTAWKALREAGAAPSYWREGDEGDWVRAR